MLPSRVSVIDEEGRRRVVHPTEVKGRWHTRRLWVQWGLVFFFLSIPWLKVGGEPFLLFNLSEGEFYVFGIFFRAHDTPMVLFLAMAFILFFGLLTVLWGRVWCGWACPQTVFIERVFRQVETWIEGPALTRRQNEVKKWNTDRFLKAVLKWVVYFLISTVIMHSFVAMFTGPEKLMKMILEGPSSSIGTFLFVTFSTLLILFDFGWFREQFCIFMCPYGRIQSVFQDSQTQTVAYDVARGEPRKIADCVDCSRCVQVCPTGIDIRNGASQLECIACTACMDACDDVMTRLKRPLGLIRYASQENLQKKTHSSNWFRPRTIVYALLLIAVMTLMIWKVSQRDIAMVEIFKTRGQPYITLPNQNVANLFMAEVSNQTSFPIVVTFGMDENTLIMPNNPIRLERGGYLKNPFTIQFSENILTEGKAMSELWIQTQTLEKKDQPPIVSRKDITLIGPFH